MPDHAPRPLRVAAVVLLAVAALGVIAATTAALQGWPEYRVAEAPATDLAFRTEAAYAPGSPPRQAAAVALAAAVRDTDTPATTRTIARSAGLRLSVADPAVAGRAALAIAHDLGGEVIASHVADDAGRLTLWVPPEHLNDTLARLRALADRVLHENHAAQDVGDQLVDLDARLAHNRAAEAQLVALLDDDRVAGNAQQILSVFRETQPIRERVERLAAQRLALQQRVDRATITVELEPTPEHALAAASEPDPWSFTAHARHAWSLLVTVARTVATALTYAAIVGLPVALPLTLLAAGLAAVVRRRTAGAA